MATQHTGRREGVGDVALATQHTGRMEGVGDVALATQHTGQLGSHCLRACLGEEPRLLPKGKGYVPENLRHNFRPSHRAFPSSARLLILHSTLNRTILHVVLLFPPCYLPPSSSSFFTIFFVLFDDIQCFLYTFLTQLRKKPLCNPLIITRHSI